MLKLFKKSFTVSYQILFLKLLLLCTTTSGFNYAEPPDSPEELNRRGQVEAISCELGSGSSCTSVSGCRSGQTGPLNAPYVSLLQNILANCTVDDIEDSSLPSSAKTGNGKIRITSSNKDDCLNIRINVGSTDNPSVSFWIYTESPQPRACNLFRVGGAQVAISSSQTITVNTTQNAAIYGLVKSKQWIHVYIRSESPTKSSVFINGKYYAAADNTGFPKDPSTIMLNIECDDLSMVDFRFYRQYLLNRDIEKEIFEGSSLTNTPISFPACRCPLSYPVLVMRDSDPSGVFCEAVKPGSMVPRLTNKNVDSLRDGNTSTYWEGSAGSQTVTFTFDQVFMIDSVALSFMSSGRSNSVKIGLFVNDTEKNTNSTSVSSDSVKWDVRTNSPSGNSTRSEVEEMVANKIEIILSSTSNIEISEINIMGRCYCNGNSENSLGSCNITGKNFMCSCQTNRGIKGDSCEQCISNRYRGEEDFGCEIDCGCSSKGTKSGKLQECEQVGGQCICKSTVEGRACDTCKPLYWKLEESNPSGCTDCNCGPGGRECNKATGSCTCKQNVEEMISGRCEKCNFGFYGVNLADGCKECNCHTSGVNVRNCSDPGGVCTCKEKVQGLKCDECMDKYYNLSLTNSEGCSPCQCNKVGSQSEICDKGQGGMCRCHGNASLTNKRNCDPIFESLRLIPDFGPISGNTTVTVRGRLFGNGSVVVPIVVIGENEILTLNTVSDVSLTFTTRRRDSVGKVTVTLQWPNVYEVGTSKDFIKKFQFEYRPDPVVKPDLAQSLKAFKRGGCKIPIRGTNLDSVSQPVLIVYSESGVKLKTEQCSVSSSTEILCNSPSGYSPGTVLRFGVGLDGTTMYEANSTFSNAQINIVTDPVPTREVDENQEYRPVFKVELQIEGQEFTSGCADSDFRVELKGASSSYPCVITSRGRNLIKCEPDIGFPGVDEEVDMMLYIGGHEYNIQRVTLYQFWSTWQFILIAVGGSIFLLLVILLPIILCCLCRNKKVETISNENGLLTNDQSGVTVTPLDNFDSIGLLDSQNRPRARPNSYEGVQLEKECWDSFIHKVNQSVRKMLNASHMEKSDVVVGTRCIKKGSEIRIVDGNFAQGTGKPYAGRPAMIKTLVNSYSNFENDLLPDWVNTGLQECLRFRDAFDENILQIKGIATDKDRFYITYPGFKRSLKDYLSDKNNDLTDALLLDKCVQILEAVQFLHNIDIVHKDLAARNCVVCDDDRIMVTDAAFSWNLYPEEYMYDNRRESYLPFWMEKFRELVRGGISVLQIFRCLIIQWSFGVLIWEIMSSCLYLPFHEITEDAKIQNHVEAGYILGKPEKATNALYNEVMLRCWDKQSSHRLKVSEIGDKFDQILNPNSDDPSELYVNNTNELMSDNIYTNYAFH
ncbi:uncharacterized protein LOC134265628 [Saccostrea cucullata]|uniref:uncharacterized protein LOC134265628 n=1 Tax=Saccostrea cuccullata TaxID=36930 RepID=UPI002ED0C838